MRKDFFHRTASEAILVGIFSCMFFSIRFTNLLIILYVVNWLIGSSWKAFTWQSKDWLLLLVVSPWILELLSVLYSTHMLNGLHQVEKRLALFAIPVITLHSKDNAVKDRTTLFRIAIICTLLATCYCLLLALYHVIFQSARMAYWEEFTQPIIFAPVYISLVINTLSVWIIFRLMECWIFLSMSRKMLYLSLIAYFGVVTFLLASKLHSVIFILIVMIGMILIYRKFKVSKMVSIAIVVLLIIVGFSVSKSEIKERFAHIHNLTIPPFNAPDAEFNELTLRLAIFKCATYIIKENPVFGTGIGDVMADMETIYRKVDFKFGYNNAYDPHNQYLRICLGTGLVGLTFFVTGLLVVLKMALRAGDWLVVGVTMLYGASFLFESILERHNGIIPYAFIFSVLVFGSNSMKEELGAGTDKPGPNEVNQ